MIPSQRLKYRREDCQRRRARGPVPKSLPASAETQEFQPNTRFGIAWMHNALNGESKTMPAALRHVQSQWRKRCWSRFEELERIAYAGIQRQTGAGRVDQSYGPREIKRNRERDSARNLFSFSIRCKGPFDIECDRQQCTAISPKSKTSSVRSTTSPDPHNAFVMQSPLMG